MGTQDPAEELLDDAIEATFPASDPVAVENAYARERRLEHRREESRRARKPSGAGGKRDPDR
jgi:hypothetical protein